MGTKSDLQLRTSTNDTRDEFLCILLCVVLDTHSEGCPDVRAFINLFSFATRSESRRFVFAHIAVARLQQTRSLMDLHICTMGVGTTLTRTRPQNQSILTCTKSRQRRGRRRRRHKYNSSSPSKADGEAANAVHQKSDSVVKKDVELEKGCPGQCHLRVPLLNDWVWARLSSGRRCCSASRTSTPGECIRTAGVQSTYE